MTVDRQTLKQDLFYQPSTINNQLIIFQNIILVGLIGVVLAQIGAVFYLDFLNGPNFYNEQIYHDGTLWFISFLFMMVQIALVSILVFWAFNRIEDKEHIESKLAKLGF